MCICNLFLNVLRESVLKCPAVTYAILIGEVVLERCLIWTYHRLTEQMNRQFSAAPLKQSAVILKEQTKPPNVWAALICRFKWKPICQLSPACYDGVLGRAFQANTSLIFRLKQRPLFSVSFSLWDCGNTNHTPCLLFQVFNRISWLSTVSLQGKRGAILARWQAHCQLPLEVWEDSWRNKLQLYSGRQSSCSSQGLTPSGTIQWPERSWATWMLENFPVIHHCSQHREVLSYMFISLPSCFMKEGPNLNSQSLLPRKACYLKLLTT